MPYLGLSAGTDSRLTTLGRANVDGSLVVNESSADKAFRVESDGNTHMLFVNGGNNCVGIGNASPTSPLHVTGGADASTFFRSPNFYTGVGSQGLVNHNTNDLKLVSQSGDTHINMVNDLAVELYHNNAKKLETTSSGIDITGGVSIDDDNNFSFGDGTTYIQGSGANDRIKIIVTSEMMRLTSTGLGIGDNKPS